MNVHLGGRRYVVALQEHADGVRIFFRHVALNAILFQLRNRYLLKSAKPCVPDFRTALALLRQSASRRRGGGLDGQGMLTFTMTGHAPVGKVHDFTFFIVMHLVAGKASHFTL